MDGPQWLDRAVSVLVIGGGCALGVASLVVIAWVGWMLADPGRAVDYRRRVDGALHAEAGRTHWFAAVRNEARYAGNAVREATVGRHRHTGGDSLRP